MLERGPEEGSGRRLRDHQDGCCPPSATAHLRKSEENGSSDGERVRLQFESYKHRLGGRAALEKEVILLATLNLSRWRRRKVDKPTYMIIHYIQNNKHLGNQCVTLNCSVYHN